MVVRNFETWLQPTKRTCSFNNCIIFFKISRTIDREFKHLLNFEMTPTPLTTDLKLPTEGVKIQVANTRAFVGDDEVGCGTLCVAERYFSLYLQSVKL